MSSHLRSVPSDIGDYSRSGSEAKTFIDRDTFGCKVGHAQPPSDPSLNLARSPDPPSREPSMPVPPYALRYPESPRFPAPSRGHE
jgi:hypothetical protein